MVIVATVLPLIRSQEWWIRWFDFPRLQLFVLGMAALGLAFLWGGYTSRIGAFMLTALFLSIGYQGYRIFPYTPLAGHQVKAADREGSEAAIRIVTANVRMQNRQADKYLRVIAAANPDIILTTEIDQWWADRLNALDAAYPYRVQCPQENTYGMILHSRFPLVEPSVQFLIEPGVPSIHSGIRLSGGHSVHLIGLHPRPPGPTESDDTTERDAELIVAGNTARRWQRPVMVIGDLNDVAWSHTTTLFQKISGLLDPRIGRGMFNTFHADYFFVRFPLDHIFHSAHFNVIELRRLAHIGSDHYPIYAALGFNARKDLSQQPAPPQEEEKKEAEDIREEAI